MPSSHPHGIMEHQSGNGYLFDSSIFVIYGFRKRYLLASLNYKPSHYLNQCWNIVNWTPGNKLQWNLNRNLYIFIQENTYENGVYEMVSILSQPQWVNICHFFILHTTTEESYIVGLEQDCSNSIANALELLQSCTKPSIGISSLRPRDTCMHQ